MDHSSCTCGRVNCHAEDQSDLDWWRFVGLYLGYPKCCVDAFCRGDHLIDTYSDDVHQSTGFIPCRKCCNKIKVGKSSLSDLITGRRAKSNFPLFTDEDREEMYAFLDGISL